MFLGQALLLQQALQYMPVAVYTPTPIPENENLSSRSDWLKQAYLLSYAREMAIAL